MRMWPSQHAPSHCHTAIIWAGKTVSMQEDLSNEGSTQTYAQVNRTEISSPQVGQQQIATQLACICSCQNSSTSALPTALDSTISTPLSYSLSPTHAGHSTCCSLTRLQLWQACRKRHVLCHLSCSLQPEADPVALEHNELHITQEGRPHCGTCTACHRVSHEP